MVAPGLEQMTWWETRLHKNVCMEVAWMAYDSGHTMMLGVCYDEVARHAFAQQGFSVISRLSPQDGMGKHVSQVELFQALLSSKLSCKGLVDSSRKICLPGWAAQRQHAAQGKGAVREAAWKACPRNPLWHQRASTQTMHAFCLVSLGSHLQATITKGLGKRPSAGTAWGQSSSFWEHSEQPAKRAKGQHEFAMPPATCAPAHPRRSQRKGQRKEQGQRKVQQDRGHLLDLRRNRTQSKELRKPQGRCCRRRLRLPTARASCYSFLPFSAQVASSSQEWVPAAMAKGSKMYIVSKRKLATAWRLEGQPQVARA